MVRAAASFPLELIPELAQLGLFGMHLEGYGLPEASSVMYGLVCQELEAGDAGIRSLVSVQGSLSMFAIWKWGSEEQKQRWLPAMHAGEKIGCFGLTEPDAGSDPGAMRTTAKRDGSDWILNGAKMWITNGSIADVAVVWARTEDGEINGFLVEKDMPGFEAPLMHHKLSLRASVTSELVLARRARARGEPLPRDRLAARAALLPERGALRDRVRRRRLGAHVPRDGARLREGADRLRQADRRLPAHAAEARGDGARGEPRRARRAPPRPDEGRRERCAPSTSRMGKMGNVRGALEVARTARSILGGNGITLEYPVIRHMNNLETVLTYEGTHEVHTLSVGKALTGENAFR